MKLLQNAGVLTAIISARQSPIVLRRASDLGIAHVMQGIHNKKEAFEELLRTTQTSAEHCGFVGDDVIDLPILTRVGFAASVPNGHAEVRSRVHYVTQAGGGRGAARELCDFILRSQGAYDAAIASYLS
jgi:3-deoxy-D-manno-octulosonate 8-phosphate phosphatase (KDO 8-P phosphatase)